MAIYKNKVEWRGEHLGYTWLQNGVEMEFSAPPDLFGKAGVLTPEDAFVAAANTCYFMMVVWACGALQDGSGLPCKSRPKARWRSTWTAPPGLSG